VGKCQIKANSAQLELELGLSLAKLATYSLAISGWQDYVFCMLLLNTSVISFTYKIYQGLQ
jgi:hypothetical protein